jgi:hypothetical protein
MHRGSVLPPFCASSFFHINSRLQKFTWIKFCIESSTRDRFDLSILELDFEKSDRRKILDEFDQAANFAATTDHTLLNSDLNLQVLRFVKYV